MFSYYGSKSKIVKYYPPPKYDKIIEPFAGSAQYSLLYKNKSVLLNEKYKIIYDIWKWLINDASSENILSNADFYKGQDISQIDLPVAHKDLIGFCINRGSISPKSIVQKWSCQVATKPNWASTTNYQLKKIAQLLCDIKHWNVQFGDYKNLPNIEATWFIDPPYQFGGEHYSVKDIDYSELAEWCKSRKGQVIVCENTKAEWIEVTPLVTMRGSKYTTVEGMWSNMKIESLESENQLF